MPDESLEAAAALYEAYQKRQEQERRAPKPRSLYQRVKESPLVAGAEGAFQGAMEGLGSLGHAATIPARLVAGAATKRFEGSPEFSTVDYALYGYDPETGAGGVQYGDLLAGTMEDTGEIAKGGLASKIIRFAGNTITDPMAAPAMLGTAEAAGSLAGRKPPAPKPSVSRAPRSRLSPTSRGMPKVPKAGPQQGPPPPPPGGPGPAGPPPQGPPQPFNPTATQAFDPGATQPVRWYNPYIRG